MGTSGGAGQRLCPRDQVAAGLVGVAAFGIALAILAERPGGGIDVEAIVDEGEQLVESLARIGE